ncbi:hypothetical protein BGZ79_010320 [Entomortierella chlamydospora]|nr:hypothetical protein BGZ79_010320 [Entomortierella chlamydospora]
MSATIGDSEGSGEASNAIVPSLALAHLVPVDDCGDNANIGGSSNPVLQSPASLPELVSEPETPLQKQVIGAAVSSATSLLSFPKDPCRQTPEFDSLYQHQALRQRTPQQLHRLQRVANLEDTPSPLSINIKTHGEAINASSMAQNPYIQHNNTIRYTATNMIPTPESPESSSSDSSSAFHSPSTSITWGPPSTINRGSLIAISHFASRSERSSQSQSKGKGVMRTYRYSRRRTGRACFDGMPREIKIHVFRYLSTFQLVRISRVSRSWRGLAMDGSLWKAIDVTRYYKTIQDNQLRILGTAASGFLRYANFRGCSQLSSYSLSVIAEHCPNIERLNLTGCRAITSKSIVDVCMNMPLLVHLDLAGLQSVNNNTLQTMAVYCRAIQVLNLAWCKQISGSGLIKLARSCQELRKLNISGCTNLEDRLMPVMGVNLPKLRELCLNGCNSLTDRGLIGLLSGLSLGSSKKHRKWRMRKRMSSSVRVSSLGHLLINQSSSNGDDNDEDSEEEQDKEDSVKEEESDRESDASDEDADGEDGNEATNSSPTQHSSTVANTPSQITQEDKDGHQTRLVYLGLSQCRLLTHEALRAIGHLCSQHLRRLELSNCENIGDEGLIQLAQRCSRLRLLDLEDVGNLTDVSLRAFAMYLPKLERICLSYSENITDQGIIRMLRPASNPTTLSTATAMMINAETASLYCRKLVHLELDNCPLITDQLLLEFANVLEERAAASMERQKERERKREERRERIRQKKRAVSPQKQSGYGLEDKGEEHSPRASSDQTGVEQGQDTSAAESSSMASVAGASFASSRPVNIPNRFRHIPAIVGSSLTSYSSSPLQPRSVLASTLLSDEVVIKKTRPGTRIMVPARSASTSSTTSCTSLPPWNSGASSRRNNSSVTIVNGGRRANGVVVNKPIRPTIQVFDCRNITLEGVEAAQTQCSSLTIRSYYSWTHPETSAPTTSAAFGGSSAIEGVDGDEGDEDTDTEHNMNTSQTSLHHLQLQQQHLQQYLQHRSRASDLLRRARLGLIGRTGGTQDAQCTIL